MSRHGNSGSIDHVIVTGPFDWLPRHHRPAGNRPVPAVLLFNLIETVPKINHFIDPHIDDDPGVVREFADQLFELIQFRLNDSHMRIGCGEQLLDYLMEKRKMAEIRK